MALVQSFVDAAAKCVPYADEHPERVLFLNPLLPDGFAIRLLPDSASSSDSLRPIVYYHITFPLHAALLVPRMCPQCKPPPS